MSWQKNDSSLKVEMSKILLNNEESMNTLNQISNFLLGNGGSNSVAIATNTSVKNNIYNFRSEKDNTTAQLVVSKKNTDNQVYSVFIRFLGTVNERRSWEISINKDDQDIPWHRFVKYSGSRSFSFKVVGGDESYIKIKECDENTLGVRYIDLHSSCLRLRKTLPSLAIQSLITKARTFPTEGYKEIRFHETIVIMTINEGSERRSRFEIYVADDESADFIKCSSIYSRRGHSGMLGLDVEFKGQTHLLELLPMIAQGDVSDDDIKWDGQKISTAN